MENDRSAPATKVDLQDGLQTLKDEILRNTKSDLQEHLQEFKAEILGTTRGEMQTFKDEILEAMRDNQTELLRAFYSFA